MNQIDLRGRKAIVTGGVRGIGFAIAQRLLASGADCSLWDRDVKALEAAAKALAGSTAVHTAAVELTQPDSVKAAADATFNAFGCVDILVNNAGIAGANKKTWEFAPEEWHEVIQVNLFAVFLCCRAGLP